MVAFALSTIKDMASSQVAGSSWPFSRRIKGVFNRSGWWIEDHLLTHGSILLSANLDVCCPRPECLPVQSFGSQTALIDSITNTSPDTDHAAIFHPNIQPAAITVCSVSYFDTVTIVDWEGSY